LNVLGFGELSMMGKAKDRVTILESGRKVLLDDFI